MNYIEAIIVGVVEGVTEFLPVSSTGHMIVISEILNMEQNELLISFEVIIQFAAILAVIMYYRKRIKNLLPIWKHIAAAFLPVAIIGYIFSDYIRLLFSVKIVAVAFIIGGIIFIITEWWYKDNSSNHVKEVEKITMKQAVMIGFIQLLSFIPGTSRSGATIIGGMLFGVSRTTATEFSFLLALPVLGAVAIYDVLKNFDIIIQGGHLDIFVIGLVTAFIVSYVSIISLVRFIEKFTFNIFGWYRIVFGALLLILFI